MNADEGLLSPDESEALLAAVRAAPGPNAHAEPTRIGAPDAPLLRAQRRVDDAIAGLVSVLRETILRMAQATPRVSAGPSRATTQDLAPVPVGGARWQLVQDGRCIGVVALDAKLAAALLDRRLGTPEEAVPEAAPPADGDDLLDEPPRPLSAIDRRMLEPLAEGLRAGLAASGLLGPTPLALAPHRSDSIEPPIAQPVLRVDFSIELGARSDTVALELLPPAFAARALAAGAPAAKPPIHRAVSGVEIELVALLGEARSTVRDLLGLGVGSVVKLDAPADRPLTVWAGDVPVLRGTPQVVAGHIALEITEHAGHSAGR